MLALTPLVLQLISLGVSVAPELISAAQTEISLVTGTSAPTAEQQAQIDSALAAANSALQAAQPATSG
jgi:hypothetical protein